MTVEFLIGFGIFIVFASGVGIVTLHAGLARVEHHLSRSACRGSFGHKADDNRLVEVLSRIERKLDNIETQRGK